MGGRRRSTVLGPLAEDPLERERSTHPLAFGLLAVAILGLVLAWMRYDPITGGPTACPAGSTTAPLDFADFDDERQACTIANTTATRVEFGTAARNTGFLPFSVTEVRLDHLDAGAFAVEGVLMEAEGGETREEAVPFEPFSLGPGDERMLWVTGSMHDCGEARRQRAYTFHHLPLRTRLLGLPRDSEATMDTPVRLVVEVC